MSTPGDCYHLQSLGRSLQNTEVSVLSLSSVLISSCFSTKRIVLIYNIKSILVASIKINPESLRRTETSLESLETSLKFQQLNKYSKIFKANHKVISN